MAFYAVEFGGTFTEPDVGTYQVFAFDTDSQRSHWLADAPRLRRSRARVYANDPVVRRSKLTYDGSHEGLLAIAHRTQEQARLNGIPHRAMACVSLYALQEQYETMSIKVTAARHNWQQHIERSESDFDPYETERARQEYMTARERLDGFVQGLLALGIRYSDITGDATDG